MPAKEDTLILPISLVDDTLNSIAVLNQVLEKYEHILSEEDLMRVKFVSKTSQGVRDRIEQMIKDAIRGK